MSSQDNDQDIRVVAAVLISAILLAVGLAFAASPGDVCRSCDVGAAFWAVGGLRIEATPPVSIDGAAMVEDSYCLRAFRTIW